MREWIKKGKTKEDAIEEALKLLRDDSEVKKLVLENKAGVAKMILFEYDEEAVMRARDKDTEKRAKAEKAIEVAKAMLADGVPIEKVSQYSSIPVDELKKLLQ